MENEPTTHVALSENQESARMPLGMKIVVAYFAVIAAIGIFNIVSQVKTIFAGPTEQMLEVMRAGTITSLSIVSLVWGIISIGILSILILAIAKRKKWGAKAIIAWEILTTSIGAASLVFVAVALRPVFIEALIADGIDLSQIPTAVWLVALLPIIMGVLLAVVPAVLVIIYVYRKRAYFTK